MHQGGYVDGFFLALDRNTSTLRLSAISDGRTWEGRIAAQRSKASDPWVAMKVTPKGYVWLLGRETSEVWWNSGIGSVPFKPVQGAFLNSGVGNAHDSAAVLGEYVYWLHENKEGQRLVMRGTPSYQIEEISTPDVAARFADLADVDDAVGWAYQQDGHAFYVLEFGRAGTTWVYDVTTTVWHERETWDKGRGQAWRPRLYAKAFGKDLVGDRAGASIFELTPHSGVDVSGKGMRRLRQLPILAAGRRTLIYNELELDYERGRAGDYAKPFKMRLSWSDDSGTTFGPDMQRPSAKGKYRARLRWNQLGSARDRVFRLICNADEPIHLTGAEIDVTPCNW